MSQSYKISITELQDYLVGQLEGTDWFVPLRFFIKHREFTMILEQLLAQRAMGRRFTPHVSRIFRPFQICAKKDVGLVLSREGPWPNPMFNDGLALSSRDPMHWDHKNFCQFAGIPPGDLSYLSSRGTLLLNAGLTRQVNSDLHTEIWSPFMAVLLEILPPVTWVTIGPNPLSKHHEMIEFPNPTHLDAKSEILFNLLGGL